MPSVKPSIALSVALISAAASQLAYAHGGSGSEFGNVGDPKSVTRTVKVEMSEYAFQSNGLKFKAGETVRFVLSNRGKLMHEMTIGSQAEQLAHRKSMQEMSDMGHGEGQHEMPANAVHVAPGATKELVWHFTKAGGIQIACNYPGHADLGMENDVTVE
jgi:uncharacterized cupredoxin-like copper-binding protein